MIITRAPDVHLTRWLERVAAFFEQAVLTPSQCAITMKQIVYKTRQFRTNLWLPKMFEDWPPDHISGCSLSQTDLRLPNHANRTSQIAWEVPNSVTNSKCKIYNNLWNCRCCMFVQNVVQIIRTYVILLKLVRQALCVCRHMHERAVRTCFCQL